MCDHRKREAVQKTSSFLQDVRGAKKGGGIGKRGKNTDECLLKGCGVNRSKNNNKWIGGKRRKPETEAEMLELGGKTTIYIRYRVKKGGKSAGRQGVWALSLDRGETKKLGKKKKRWSEGERTFWSLIKGTPKEGWRSWKKGNSKSAMGGSGKKGLRR